MIRAMSTRRMTFAGRFARGTSGAAAVEFAMILPVLVVMLFGAIEFGRLVHDYHVVTKGVRDATRFLSRVPASCPGGAGPGVIDDANDITRARNLAMTGSTAGGSYLLGYWTSPATISVAVDCVANDQGGGPRYQGIYDGVGSIPLVTLTATVPFDFMLGILVSAVPTLTFAVSQNEASLGE